MRRKPNKGQRYFPNSCEAIRNTPDKYFPSMPYEAFEDWKVYGYQIPESVFAIRSAELLRDILKHPHKDELVNIMLQQMAESNNTYSISTPSK